MKIQCDFCSAEAAAVFCCADEAALCGACDRRVHHANKLAGKHCRLSLLHPSASAHNAPPFPLCDICQERRGFLFCQEDRAIMCRDCDASIHSANHLTAGHARFLLTGTKVSALPMPVSDTEVEAATETSSRISDCTTDRQIVEVELEQEILRSVSDNSASNNNDSSSISEYLINTLPGWHVDDFLFDESAAANSLYHQVDNEAMLITESSREGFEDTSSIWQHYADTTDCSDYGSSSGKLNRKRGSEGGYVVPHFQTGCNGKMQRTGPLC